MKSKATDSEASPEAPAEAERRKRERRAIRRSHQVVLRNIVDRLADGIVIVSDDGRIRFANPAAEALFDRPSHELVGQEFGFPLSSTDGTEIEIVRRDKGVIVVELRHVEAAWDDEPAILVSLRDVTDRKRAEERERLLEGERQGRAEAEAANKAKSEFLAVMSHELRTPLNAVLGYAELLDLGVGGSLSGEQRQQIGRISASGRHLLGLVNEILDLAKVEAGRMSVERVPTRVSDVVEAAIVLAQPQAESRGITMRVPVDIPRTAQFLGDHDRVTQILVNLLSNAVKFTEPGGVISIEVGEGVVDSGVWRHHGEGSWTAIRVRDTGIGVAAEQLESIFSPFVQAEGGHTRRSDGTGLGLTISRRLARLMRGDVTVESTEGAGSVFTVWLPSVAPALDIAHPPDQASSIEPDATRTRGLAEIGDHLMHEMEPILDAFAAQLRAESLMPAAPTLRYSQLVDHTGALLADIATALITLDESRGSPSALLHDSADIQRFLADRHGLQRSRLGWSTAALVRENEILLAEIERAIHRCMTDPACAPQVDEALIVIRRLLEQGTEISRRALERSAHQEERRTD